MKIPVYKGAHLHGWAQVDPQDYEQLVQRLWKVAPNGYATSNLSGGGALLMHREVLGLAVGDGLDGDHVNGDRLDNRRANLRVSDRQRNAQNVASRGGSSRYRGVTWVAPKRRWRAQAQINGRNHHLGYYADELSAARAASDFRREHMPHANPARDLCEETTPRRAA